MCGIAGLIQADATGGTVDPAALQRALLSVRHRGPDACGAFHVDNLWFGHVRLSIIDLSSDANQPMTTADGRFTICYNGEVYNFRELATELALDNLRTQSDTEVILRAFEHLGAGCFAKLKGIFAFALYDAQARKVWLVRDRLGVKPLYYFIDSQRLVFGSEIKALQALLSEPPVCDTDALHEWLYYGNALGGRTLYRGIRQVLPGNYLQLNLADFSWRTREYWSLRETSRVARQVTEPVEAIIARTRELLEAAVKRQLVSDVPVGVFLSGGVDSTAITALASRHYAGKLKTYSAGFDDFGGVDERPKARRLAELYGTEHHELHIAGGDVPDLVEKMVHHHDLPFADAANIPLYLMARQISAQTKVVLQGDGGDELFGGYRRYTTLSYYKLLHAAAHALRPLHDLTGKSALHYRVSRYLSAFAAPTLADTTALLMTVEDVRSKPTAPFGPMLRERLAAADPFQRYRECQSVFAQRAFADQMSLIDLSIHLPDVFLEKVDRSTMAASLEVRVPFLDEDLVDYVTALPSSLKTPYGRKKWLLKKALAGVVPDYVLYGRKTGFGVPFGFWLRSALKPFFFDHLETLTATRPELLERSVVEAWYREFETGKRDRAFGLWKLLNFMVWCNTTKVVFSES